MRRVITVIVQTTSDCNLACQYCYVIASRRTTARFPIEKVAMLITNCSKDFDSVQFCWHGGEPLLVGKHFYETVLVAQKMLQQTRDVKFENSIQTNGTLLTENWLDFFKEHNFRIGLSFDAPPDIHERQRLAISGKIGIQDCLKLFQKIKDASFPLGLLCVITKSNVLCGKEIFNFFSEIGVSSYSLLPLIEVPSDSRLAPPNNQELFELYKTTFDLWLFAKHSFTCIEPIYSMVSSILGESPRLCTFASSCLKRMITITSQGDIVPCGSLVSDNFILGNIFEVSLSNAICSKQSLELRQNRASAVRKWCQSCEFVSICRGGCRESAFWFSKNYLGPYPYCEARKQMFRYIRDTLSVILRKERTTSSQKIKVS